MKGRGFWWNWSTKEVVDVTDTSHIREVIANPSMFGVTHEFIRRVYAGTSEPIGFEGRARAEIMSHIIKSTAWIRFRESKPKSHYWTVEFSSPVSDLIPVTIEEVCRQAIQVYAPSDLALGWTKFYPLDLNITQGVLT